MDKIEVTQAHIDQIEAHTEKYEKIGLRTERINVQELAELARDPSIKSVEDWVGMFYREILSQDPPEKGVMFFDSPNKLWDYVQQETGEKMDIVWSYLSGSFDCNIFARYDFFIDIVGAKTEEDKLRKYNLWRGELAMGPIYMFDDVCLISQRPSVLQRKDKKFHCENGPALAFADGSCSYFLNGVKVPKYVVMTPKEEFDMSMLAKETNAEVRAQIVRKLGMDFILEKMDATVLDKADGFTIWNIPKDDPRPFLKDVYTLYSLDIGDGNHRPYLHMFNPSTGLIHVEGVPTEITTAKEAVTFRNGTDECPMWLW